MLSELSPSLSFYIQKVGRNDAHLERWLRGWKMSELAEGYYGRRNKRKGKKEEKERGENSGRRKERSKGGGKKEALLLLPLHL